MFKFAPDKVEKNVTEDELKNSTTTSKSNDAKSISCDNGRKRKTRTYNPALPKRVRYQLRQFPL